MTTFTETFLSWRDAATWIDGCIRDYSTSDIEALNVNLIDGIYRVRISCQRSYKYDVV